MTFEELWEQMEGTHQEAMHLSKTKGKDYAGADNDPLRHFVKAAAAAGVTPEQVWLVFCGKHWSAIETYVRNGTVASEPIEGRIDDTIVYLHLLKAMVFEARQDDAVDSSGSITKNSDEEESMEDGKVFFKGLNDYTPDSRDIPVGGVYSQQKAIEERGEVPKGFGVTGLNWGVFGNARFGDCFFAAYAHGFMALAKLLGRTPTFTEEGILLSYAKYLGVKHLTEENDTGTDPNTGSKFMSKTGEEAADGHWRKWGNWAFETDGSDYEKLVNEAYDFGTLNLCLSLQKAQEEQFAEAEAAGFKEKPVWKYVAGSEDVGGHSIEVVARDEPTGLLIAISWGQEVLIDPSLPANQLQCAIARMSKADVDAEGKSAISGLDWAQLDSALAEVTS